MKIVNNRSNEVVLNEIILYEHIGVVARIMKELNMNEKEAKELFDDAKRFLFLSVTTDEKISPTTLIDEAWHTFLLYTKDYYDFCFKHFGRMVHHKPFDEQHHKNVADRSDLTLRLAHSHFGSSLSRNWDFSIHGQGCCCEGKPLPSCCPEMNYTSK
mgnify:CR=1 FL=1